MDTYCDILFLSKSFVCVFLNFQSNPSMLCATLVLYNRWRQWLTLCDPPPCLTLLPQYRHNLTPAELLEFVYFFLTFFFLFYISFLFCPTPAFYLLILIIFLRLFHSNMCSVYDIRRSIILSHFSSRIILIYTHIYISLIFFFRKFSCKLSVPGIR